MTPEEKIRELGYVLPPVSTPAFSFVNYRLIGDMLYISGNGPKDADGVTSKGKLGADVTVEDGYKHARLAGLRLLAVAKDALGDLGRIRAVVKMLGMVNATPDFTDHPKVINGCSDLFVEVLGAEVGGHARSAVGFSSLPGNMTVEIEVIMQVKI